MDVFVGTTPQPSTKDDQLQKFATWKTTLPPKFEFVRSDSTSAPLTPPALLLQLTHFATVLALSPSQAWLERILDLLDTCRQQLGASKLPSIFTCLLESIRKSSKSLPLEEGTRNRINRAVATFAATPESGPVRTLTTRPEEGIYAVERLSHNRPSQVSTMPIAPSYSESMVARPPQQQQQSHQRPLQQQPHQSTSLIDNLLPDLNSSQQPQSAHTVDFSPNPIDTDFTSPALDAYDPSISGDLESFFDELATLHGAKKLQNQPQFMQNLGFAPEVSMADLLATQSGQYMHMDPAAFGTEHEGEPMQFPLSDYYNTG